jgi:hypothetical protein
MPVAIGLARAAAERREASAPAADGSRKRALRGALPRPRIIGW